MGGGGQVGAVLAKVNLDASEVHVWQISLPPPRESPEKVSIFEIKTQQSVESLLEIAYANNEGDPDLIDTSFETATFSTHLVGCGVRLMSKGDRLSASGTFEDSRCSMESSSKDDGGSASSGCFESNSLQNLSLTNGGTCFDTSPTVGSWNSSHCADFLSLNLMGPMPDFGEISSLDLTDFSTKATPQPIATTTLT